jgi:hypothetical protein
METAVDAETAMVAAVKVALVLPAGTVTVLGTDATAVLLLVSGTDMPPPGAAAFSVTVPCELLPPTTLVGFMATVDTARDFI